MFPEFAFSSIFLIAIVLFPGLVFRRFFYSYKFTQQFNKGEWSERLVTSTFWGICAQLITLLILSYIPWVEKNIFSNTLRSRIEKFSFSEFNIETDRDILYFTLLYIFLSIVIAGLLGFLLFKLIRYLKLDVSSYALRYANQWHYLFEGETPKNKNGVLITWVNITINSEEEGKTKMIQGVLDSYSIDSNTGNLDYIYLREAKRYSQTEGVFKDIFSDIFVVPLTNVIDINIRYKEKLKEKLKQEVNNKQEVNSNNDIPNEVFIFFSSFFMAVLIFLPWVIAFNKNIHFSLVIFSYIPLFFSYIALLGLIIDLYQKKWKSATINLGVFILTTAFFIAYYKFLS